MKFNFINIEISGVKDVRIDGNLYTRTTVTHLSGSGKKITVKYFRREKDGYLITEDKFMKKLAKLQRATQQFSYLREHYDCFGYGFKIKTGDVALKWRFWFSEGTLNVEKILI